MRPHARARYRFPRLAVALGLLWFAGAAGAAEGGDHDRWVPSFGVFFDFTGQKASGSLTSGDVLGPPLSPFDTELDALFPGSGCLQRNPFTDAPTGRTGALCTTARTDPTKIAPDSQGSDTAIAPLVGGSLELMTPSPFDGFLYPRLFVHGDYAAAFTFERNVAGQGDPDQFAGPEVYAGTTNDVEELAIQGQGSRARWQLSRDIWSAGGGVAFTFSLFERTVRIKPSFEWIHFNQEFIGVVHRSVKQQVPSQCCRDANNRVILSDLSRFRGIALTHIEDHDFDGVGPGVEVEVDASRLGPFLTSVFALGRGYHIMGDTEQSFSATNEFGETASWTIEPEKWIWRAGVGLRFRWVPERD